MLFNLYINTQGARRLWNLCVSRTNALITEVHISAVDYRNDLPIAESEALCRIRVHCCNLLDASLGTLPATSGGQLQPQMRAQDALVGLTFTSRVRMMFKLCIYPELLLHCFELLILKRNFIHLRDADCNIAARGQPV